MSWKQDVHMVNQVTDDLIGTVCGLRGKELVSASITQAIGGVTCLQCLRMIRDAEK